MKAYFIRHGETDENTKGILQGQYNSALNENGLLQAEKVSEGLSQVKFKKIISTDLSRGLNTAKKILGKQKEGCEIIESKDLREKTSGIYDNTPKKKVIEDNNISNNEELEDFLRSAPGAETREDLKKRAKRVLEMLASETGDDDTICIVSHGGILNYIMKEINPTLENISFGNTAITIVERTGDIWKISSLNDTNHLNN